MSKGWDLIARYVKRDDPDTVYFVRMRSINEYSCSCGGLVDGSTDESVCRHIRHAYNEVVDEQGTIALCSGTQAPPKKYGNRKKQITWWVERNVQQYLEE